MRGIAVRELLEGFFDGSQEELIRFLGAKPADAAAAAAAASGGPATVQKPSDPAPEEPEPPIDTVLL
jgi:hypothetical protein